MEYQTDNAKKAQARGGSHHTYASCFFLRRFRLRSGRQLHLHAISLARLHIPQHTFRQQLAIRVNCCLRYCCVPPNFNMQCGSTKFACNRCLVPMGRKLRIHADAVFRALHAKQPVDQAAVHPRHRARVEQMAGAPCRPRADRCPRPERRASHRRPGSRERRDRPGRVHAGGP